MALPARGHELSSRMLPLFKDADSNVSLGAMLVAPPVSDNEELIQYVRRNLKKSDPAVARMAKRYYLARTSAAPKDTVDFINEFPEIPEELEEVLVFDTALTRTGNGIMLEYLVSLADCSVQKNIREAARDKIDRLRMPLLLSGWHGEPFPNDDFLECKDR